MTLSKRSGDRADDPFGGRVPTSHERLSGLPWDASYHDGPAPWDLGRPQPAIVRLASEGGFVGAVLDAGCGTGENALHVASLELPVLGVDVAETALAIARQKAETRGLEVEFVAADALRMARLGRSFGTVLDCGLFHTFDGEERPRYAAGLASVTEHDGTLYVLCFSDDGPDAGPHPASRAELSAAFNPAPGGTSPPSNRAGSRPGTTTAAHRPGWRRSSGSSNAVSASAARSRTGWCCCMPGRSCCSVRSPPRSV
jgi:SAM-dependent methyltransferase